MSKEVKPFNTYQQQIEHLISIGLAIEDPAEAKSILSTINYYRLINGYSLGLYDAQEAEHRYKQGITFYQIYDLYVFDTKIRHILSEMLEEFEIIFRTKIAYHIGMNYGALGYLDSQIFESIEYHQDFLTSFEREKEHQDRSPIVKHHINQYDGKLPIWAACEILSFGTMSKLYKNMKRADREEIAKELVTSSKYLSSWLRSFVEVRNICAHYGRLYNKQLLFPPKLYRNMAFGNQNIFSVIFILKRFINDSSWVNIYVRLKAAILQHTSVDMARIGFPQNWEQLLKP